MIRPYLLVVVMVYLVLVVLLHQVVVLAEVSKLLLKILQETALSNLVVD